MAKLYFKNIHPFYYAEKQTKVITLFNISPKFWQVFFIYSFFWFYFLKFLQSYKTASFKIVNNTLFKEQF